MSLIIKGMSLPRSCSTCRFSYFTVGIKKRCEISGDEVNPLIDQRETNCPLSEIPTPHGRLIDADELFFKTDGIKGWDYGDESDMAISAAEALSAIDDSPTVIEAEE